MQFALADRHTAEQRTFDLAAVTARRKLNGCFGATVNLPIAVSTTTPGGSGWVGLVRRIVTSHVPFAVGQVTQPFLLQISISPFGLTLQTQRAPLAVLSMHMPTASRPVVAKALDAATMNASAATVRKVASEHCHQSSSNEPLVGRCGGIGRGNGRGFGAVNCTPTVHCVFGLSQV